MTNATDSPLTKDSYHHGQLREALLEAGNQLLREGGLKSFTLRACARRAGVSHAAPKHHFGDVQGYLTVIAARGFVLLADMLRQALASATNLDEEFLATTRAYSQFALDNPEHFRIMFRCDLLNIESEELLNAAQLTYLELTNVIIRQRGGREFTIADMEAPKTMEAIVGDIIIGWCHIHGLAHLKLERQLNMMPESMHDSVITEASVRLARMIQRQPSPESPLSSIIQESGVA